MTRSDLHFNRDILYKARADAWEVPRRLLQSSGQEMAVLWTVAVTVRLAKRSLMFLKVEPTGFPNKQGFLIAGERGWSGGRENEVK